MVKILAPLAVVIGLFFAYAHERPNFDDVGILALAIVVAAAAFGAVEPRYPWLWAVLIGGFVPLIDIGGGGQWPSILTLAFAFAGAYFGSLSRRAAQRLT